MTTIATQTASFKALAADLYGDRTPPAARGAAGAQPALLSHVMFPAMVAKMAACAHRRLDASHASKIDLAAAIVLAGGVAPCTMFHPTQGYTVQSQSSPIKTYDVIENVCNCEDYARHATHTHAYTCKHILATWLYRRVALAMAMLPPVPAYDLPTVPLCHVPTDAEGVPCYAVASPCPGHSVPPVAAAPLPEAPASVNVRIMMGGRECQVTLRDTNETRLLERLDVLMQRFPLDAPAPARGTGASVVAEGITPSCPEHGTVKESTKVPGTWYCPSRLEDDSFCPWRHPAKAARKGKR